MEYRSYVGTRIVQALTIAFIAFGAITCEAQEVYNQDKLLNAIFLAEG